MKEIMLILYKFFWEIEEEKVFPNSFYEIHIILLLKPEKVIKRKLQSNMSLKHCCQTNFFKFSKLNPTYITESLIMTTLGLCQESRLL